jgi:hypothetical protein
MGAGNIPQCANMKMSELKKLIANLPDDMEVVVSGSDHSYNKIGRRSRVVKSEFFPGHDHMSQFWGDDHKSDSSNPIIEVFWIDDGG